MDEEDEGGAMMLEEVVHGRPGRRHVHGHRGVGDQPRHAAIDVARGRRLDGAERVMRAPHVPERRIPVGRPRAALERHGLVGQPVVGRVEMIGVRHLAREAAASQLLLVDMAEERAGMRRPGDDAHFGDPAEVFEFLHGCVLLEEAYTATGNCASPRNLARPPRTTGPADRIFGKRRTSRPMATCPSMRASHIPAQAWMPVAKARCRLGARVMSRRSGSGNWAWSRLAAPMQSVMRVPAGMATPPTSTSARTRRLPSWLELS